MSERVRCIVASDRYSDGQILVSIYDNGAVEIADRPTKHAVWGPPWIVEEREA